MNQLRYKPIVILNLIILRATVAATEWALQHRKALAQIRIYAPVFAGGMAAYFVGRVVGQALLTL